MKNKLRNLKHFLWSHKKIVLLVVFLVVGMTSIALYYDYQYQQLQQNPSIVASYEIKTITQAVSQLIEVPADEEPLLATVTDKTKLTGQSFFVGCENGDKVLIYPLARLIIIYRPSTGKIVTASTLKIEP